MKSEHQLRVEDFMTKAGQHIPSVPTEPDEKTRVLRSSLIIEEALETIRKGLGIAVSDIGNGAELKIENLQFKIVADVDMTELVDGIADLSVVNIGCAAAIGVDMKPILECVDENNLAKFGPGHKIRADGKLEKPPGHKPPKILEKLIEQGYVPKTTLAF